MNKNSQLDEQRILDEWNPKPLTPKIDEEKYKSVLNPRVLSSRPGKYICVDGKKCLNLATNDFLGLSCHKSLDNAALDALHKYGVGSCGPRGFYGTVDVHLDLEQIFAKFLDLEEAILYSFGFSTIASAIPAYAKPNDVIFVDEQCNFAIQKGLTASRSQIRIFKHNDMEHLRVLLEEQNAWEKNNSKKAKALIRFLIVEGIYSKTGDLCPLPEIIELKKQFKVRLFIDESCSLGVLGSEGKGITQHYGVDISEVDMIAASLENAFCSFGGICAGSSYIVDHQRLAGQGYCFSASLPPLQTRVASQALQLLIETPALVRNAQSIFEYTQGALERLTKLICISSKESPVKHLKLKLTKLNGFVSDVDEDYIHNILEKICLEASKENLALVTPRYIVEEEISPPSPTIRLVVNGALERNDIDIAIDILENICCRIITSSNKIK